MVSVFDFLLLEDVIEEAEHDEEQTVEDALENDFSCRVHSVVGVGLAATEEWPNVAEQVHDIALLVSSAKGVHV